MLTEAAGLAVLAALSPTALLVAAVFLGAASPRRTILFYLAGAVVMMTGALWPHTQPSAAMLAAYAADPALAALRLDFTATIRELVAVMIAGLLARSSR